MQQIYRIDGMRCASCVAKVTAALERLATQVTVTLTPPRATLEGDTIAGLDALNTAIASVGSYTLTPETIEPPVSDTSANWLRTYYPLLLIVGMIAVASLKGADNLHSWMLHFMAGFFLVFGSFKLLDLRGFSTAYATYDVLAKRWPAYGLVYPFLELGLGFAFLFQVQLTAALWLSILLMGYGSIGIIKALSEKRTIRCACLGTALNLPMSTITLVEDLGMVIMSAAMLLA